MSRSLSRITNLINRLGNVDWSSWESKRVEDTLGFFLRKGLCEKANNIKDQYNILLVAFCKIESDIERMLSVSITRNNALKRFMSMHSIYDTDFKKRRDWLQRLMISILMPTKKEEYNWLNPEPVPQYLLDKFKIFNPMQIAFEMDPIKIQYGMWRRGCNGRLVDPINIIYTDFDIVKQEEVVKEIARYKNIESDPVTVSHDDDWLVEDDLPF